MFLLGLGPRTEAPGWLWQILDYALHVDLREAMSADRLHQEDPLRLSVARQDILLALGMCLITGDKIQAVQVVASSKDPLALNSGNLQALHHQPFLHLPIIYHPTHSTHFLNRVSFNQYLGTLVLWRDQSGVMSHLFNLLLVEDMVVEVIVLEWGILEEVMEVEVVWPLCSQALPLILQMMATVTTSLMATDPILRYLRCLRCLRCLHVLPSHHLQMA